MPQRVSCDYRTVADWPSTADGSCFIANAFTAAATMLDAVSEIDIKFARLCEREYEGLSAELKKWFKKMAVSWPKPLLAPAPISQIR